MTRFLVDLITKHGIEVQHRGCETCGHRLSEWYAKVPPGRRYIGPSTMFCYLCGTYSEHRWHRRRLRPWARLLLQALRHRGIVVEWKQPVEGAV